MHRDSNRVTEPRSSVARNTYQRNLPSDRGTELSARPQLDDSGASVSLITTTTTAAAATTGIRVLLLRLDQGVHVDSGSQRRAAFALPFASAKAVNGSGHFELRHSHKTRHVRVDSQYALSAQSHRLQVSDRRVVWWTVAPLL